MDQLTKFIEAYAPVLQQCLLNNDPLSYLDSLPESMEKSLITFLIQPHSIDYKQTLRNQYRVRGSLLDIIDEWKIARKVSTAKSVSQIKYLLEIFIEDNNHSFNIAKPSEFISSSNYSKEQDKKLPSKLKAIKPLSQWVAQQIDRNQDLIGSLNKKSILTISEERLIKLKTSNKEKVLRSPYIKQYSDKFGAQLVKKFFQQMLQTNKNYEIPTDILKQLSKGQFLLLAETIQNITNKPEYLKIWFNLQYGQSLQVFNKVDELTISEKDEKRALLLKILADLDQLKTSKTKSMKNAILKELVILDISREDVDKNIFIQYITNNVVQSSLQSSKNRKEKQQRKRNDRQQQIQLRANFNSSIDYDKVILSSLENLFEKPNAHEYLKELEDHFDGRVLNKIYAQKNLSKGGSFQQYKNYFSVDELKDFKEEKMITIMQSNKKKWGVNEQVILKTKIKNVKSINIKIYKLDLEKHYRQNNRDIDKLQDVSYFQPQHSYQTIVNHQNSFIIEIFDFKIQGIPQEKGAWIVEFEAEGISSRAFIRKGSIIMFTKNATNGTELKFFDELGQRIRSYVIWMEGRRIDINEDSKFILPYGETDKKVSVIFLKDSFAQKFDLEIPQQSYKLNVDYIYNSQSFIVGGSCKIIVHPKLTLTFDKELDISLNLLEKVNILVTFTNNVGIKSTIDFDNIQFKNSQDYLLQFPIQTYTTRIDILVKGRIKKYNQKHQQLSSSSFININLTEDSTSFIDFYLKNLEGNYYLSLLGRNGESIPDTEVSIEVYPSARSKSQTQTLMTSRSGIIELGSLADINRLEARVMTKSGGIGRQWQINEIQNEIHISDGSVYLRGEEIYLPYLSEQKYSLWRKDKNGGFIEKMLNKISFEGDKVCIKDLPIGDYDLQFYNAGKKINFSVVGGRQWSEQKKILDEKKGLLYELNPYQNHHFALGKAIIKKQNGKTKVQVPILSTYDNQKDPSFRAHIIASNFITPTFSGKFDIKVLRNPRNSKQDSLDSKKSQYFNNKKLSDESSYIMNRKNEKKYIGNNLQKPKLFLQRIQVRDTKQVEEDLSEGQEYQRNAMMYKKELERSRKMRADKMNEEQRKRISLDLLTTHNNFLQLPSYVIANQKRGKTLCFEIPEGYSYFQCFLSSRFSGVVKKYFVDSEQVNKKDLVHVGISFPPQNQSWAMSRQVYKVSKNESLKVSRNSTWSAVGLTNIIGFAKTKGVIIEDWVINWNTYSDQQKLSVYNEKICHQLNVYIKYNDQPFFKKIVVPFLRNKILKTFVDYCLLEDEEALKWAQLHLYQLLNQFEKVLLVHQLMKANRNEQAVIIASSMQNLNKSNRISFESFKKEFDTVITAKLTEQVASGNKDSQENQKKKKKKMKRQQRYESNKESAFCMDQCDQDESSQRGQIMQSFKQMQNTKQYTETTYRNIKYAYESQRLVKPSPFWTSVAQNLIKGKGELLSENFMYLSTPVQFTLASCFIPNHKLLQFGLKSEEENYVIEARSSFLVFVKQVKLLPFEKKFGILLNQRFFNPDDRFYYEEDGTKIEKEIHQFIIRRPYCLQTLITNTSGTKLELQLLIDLPQGSIPLKSHQHTQICSINLEPYSTLSFERFFYFPNKGSYRLYPANVCRGDQVIGKAQQIDEIEVLEVETIKNMDTLEDVLKSGQSEKVLQFLSSKNIFDSKIFNPRSILWMLKDKQFFGKVIQLLKKRKYYSPQIWIFAYYHEQLQHIVQYQNMISFQKEEDILSKLPIYEYFPYYSKRTHKFLNESKSIIRNIQLKKTYYTFLFTSILIQPTTPKSRITFIYYLLLQDRIDEANNVLLHVCQKQKKQYQLQFDYIESFIDMYKGFPSFVIARKISEKYLQHPIKAWRKLFNQIYQTLKEYDNNSDFIEENLQVQYSTTVFNEDSQIRISIPAHTEVEVFYYDINLQLYFSNFPFTNFNSFAPSIAPNRSLKFQSGLSRQQKLTFENSMKDTFIEVFSSTSKLQKKKVSSFLWSNPKIKIRIKQDRGEAQIFYEGRKQPGCYCKVYQIKAGEEGKFYRDGYTDITGTFKYALADLQGISEFAILFVTESNGGKIVRVKPPSQQTYLN